MRGKLWSGWKFLSGRPHGGGRKLASKPFRQFTAHRNQSCGYHSSYPASLSHRAARPCGSPSDCSCSGGVNPPCAEVLPPGKTLTRRIGGGRKLASKPFRRFTAHHNQSCGYHSSYPASLSHRAARPCGSPSDCSCSGGVNPPCAEVLPPGKTLTRRIGGGRKLASKPFRRFTAHHNQSCGYNSSYPASFL